MSDTDKKVKVRQVWVLKSNADRFPSFQSIQYTEPNADDVIAFAIAAEKNNALYCKLITIDTYWEIVNFNY